MIGSLGLFRQLAALGRAAPAGSAADLNKRMARLSEEAKLRFKALRAEEKSKIDAARAAAQTSFDKFLAENGLPPRPDYRKERGVVAAFVRNESASAAGLSTDGYSLKVNGREVATRDSAGSRFMKVCPGKFGEDKTSRRAANAVLDVLGAGVRIDDRDSEAFLRARAGGGGRLVSPEACYRVEVSSRIRKAAATASGEVYGPQQDLMRLIDPTGAGRASSPAASDFRLPPRAGRTYSASGEASAAPEYRLPPRSGRTSPGVAGAPRRKSRKSRR